MAARAAATAAGRRRAAAAPRPRAVTARGATVTRPVAPRVPRRVSGPARGRTALRPAPQRRRRAANPSVPARVIRLAITLPDRALVERLIRGRGWIAVIAFMLLGIVAMQVSLLNLNAGIGRAVERSADLERRNGELRAEVSRLSSGERIQAKAGSLGMVLPPAGQVRYLESRGGNDAQAAADALRAGAFATPAEVPATDTGGTVDEGQ